MPDTTEDPSYIGPDDASAEPKRERTRLAKAELWVHLAMTAERWATYCESRDDAEGRIGFSKWPADEPLVALCRTYALTPADLARCCRSLADQLENRAMRAGYEEYWDELPA